MKKPSTFEKALQEILDEKSFEKLESFNDEKIWPSMTAEEKEKLSLLFVLLGEKQFKSNDSTKSSKSFETALILSPNNCRVLHKIADIYLLHATTMEHLETSREMAERIVAIDPQYFQGWLLLANSLIGLGFCGEESSYLFEANEKFQEALKLREAHNCPEKTFYWRWGLCWHYISKQSGEAIDLHQAIQKYRLAAQEELKGTLFWNDYGNALIDLACLISRREFLDEAIDLYRLAVHETPDFFEGWLNLACCYQHLMELTGEDKFFPLAVESFESASTINSTDATLWYKWGQLLAESGKAKRQVDLLQLSFEKFARGDAYHPNHPQIFSSWAEAQMLVGAHLGRLDLLHHAKSKIEASIEIAGDKPRSWYVYGACLNELGRYFGDIQYYHQAIEKFQCGISLDRNHSSLWYGLALSHFAIGDLTNDINMIEKASRYCSKVIEVGGVPFSQFWNDWGVALMRLGDMTQDKLHVESALEKFEKAIKCHCDKYDPSTVEPQWLYNYGCALDFLGDITGDETYYERAVKMLSQTLVLDPNYLHARYNLALALAHLGETVSDLDCLNKAVEHFNIILNADNEDEIAWNDLGVTYLHIAQLINDPGQPEAHYHYYQLAESKLLQAAALGNVHSFYFLSCLYSLSGNYSSAMHYLERSESAAVLPSTTEIMEDEWLEGLRSTPAFQQFMIRLSK
jgi:tetratricopeptide (TPR) repeat protein